MGESRGRTCKWTVPPPLPTHPLPPSPLPAESAQRFSICCEEPGRGGDPVRGVQGLLEGKRPALQAEERGLTKSVELNLFGGGAHPRSLRHCPAHAAADALPLSRAFRLHVVFVLRFL